MSAQLRWHCFADRDAVAVQLAQRIAAAARQSIAARGRFSVVLAGGTTPQKAYQLLAQEDAQWPHWHLYLGDERCLAADHPKRNSVMISAAWVQRVSVPAGQQHWIRAERGSEQAAADYDPLVREALPFDLVVLGVGEDGHTASLFPGHVQDPQRLVVPVHGAPKPPAERVSLSYAALNQNRAMVLAVTGASKRAALAQWGIDSALPISRLRSPAGIDVLADEAAGGAHC
jgi:6-phosphogluconolactonase